MHTHDLEKVPHNRFKNYEWLQTLNRFDKIHSIKGKFHATHETKPKTISRNNIINYPSYFKIVKCSQPIKLLNKNHNIHHQLTNKSQNDRNHQASLTHSAKYKLNKIFSETYGILKENKVALTIQGSLDYCDKTHDSYSNDSVFNKLNENKYDKNKLKTKIIKYIHKENKDKNMLPLIQENSYKNNVRFNTEIKEEKNVYKMNHFGKMVNFMKKYCQNYNDSHSKSNSIENSKIKQDQTSTKNKHSLEFSNTFIDSLCKEHPSITPQETPH